MKRFLKSGLSLILAITIILSSAYVGLSEVDFSGVNRFVKKLTPDFSVKSYAASLGDLMFTLNADRKSYSVRDCYTFAKDGLTIPAEINGLPVTGIGDHAFYDCSWLSSITIPDSVTSIGNFAFGDCTHLFSITIPDSVTSIGDSAFNGCTGLTSITIPDGVTSIGDRAFYDCTSLTSIKIPDSVTSIEGEAFYNTGYYNDSSNWENKVLYIGNHLISAKTTLSGAYTIKDGTRTIACYAFDNCTSLTSVTIGNSVTSIGVHAFRNCTNLTSITIPDSVTSIKGCTFESCTSLTSITIPDSVTSIESEAFYNTGYYNDSSNWENKVLYIGNHLISAKRSLSGAYTIKDGTRIIADNAFEYCESITAVTIGNSVTSIGEAAFYNCTSLTSITIPDSVTSIGDWAFDGCTNLTTITIPDGVTSIGIFAFDGCTSLTSIAIPDSVTSIGYGAFSECNGKPYVFYEGTQEQWENISFDDDNAFIRNGFMHYEATDHTLSDWHIDVEPTCLSTGTKYKICTVCKHDIVWDTIHKTDHIPRRDYFSSSCTNDGGYEVYCSYCGKFLETVVTDPAPGHNFSTVWTIDKKATCIAAGSKSRHCLNEGCTDRTDITEISPLGHTSSDWIIDESATCTEGGLKHKSCTVCNKTLESANIPAKGHTSSNWIIDKQATCSVSGSKHKECTVCGKKLKNAIIPQLKPATPTLSKAQNTASGAKVTWGKVTGADSYIVYRKAYDTKAKKWGGWARLASGVTSASYVDKTAKSGYYRYTVKAVNEAGAGGYNTNGIKIYFLAMPKSVTTSNTTNTITVKWGKVAGATGYIVYRKTGSGKWTNLGKTTGTAFGDKTAKAGVTYKYTIKAYYGTYVSAYNTNGYAVRRLTTPKLSSATSKNDGILLSWSKVTGATGYIVYRKATSGEWKTIATVKGTSKVKYLDETPRKGATYQYCIKAYYGTSRSANSNIIKLKCKY